MKKSLILALAASGLTVGGIAYAQDSQRGADMTRTAAETRATERFARMDANSDGVINEADREARARARFAEQDANGDNLLSFEEVQAAREERRENRDARRAERGEQAGQRGGRRGHRMGRHGGGHMGGKMMQQADANSDGAISQAEFTAAALARFDSADADNDGTLTAEERRAQHAERGGRRGGRR